MNIFFIIWIEGRLYLFTAGALISFQPYNIFQVTLSFYALEKKSIHVANM